MNNLTYRRIKGEPVQYILGEWYFRCLTVNVQKPILIPRIETEQIIDIIKNQYQEDQQLNFLEVGTGTGSISISLLKEMNINLQKSKAIDIKGKCITLAKQNLQRNIPYILLNNNQYTNFEDFQFLKYSFLDYLKYHHNQKRDNMFKYDFIVSNPPYIATKDYQKLDKSVKYYEDQIALESGNDGLDVIKQLIFNSYQLLKDQKGCFLIFEMDSEHTNLIKEIYLQSQQLQSQFLFPKFIKDCFGVDRFCLLEKYYH